MRGEINRVRHLGLSNNDNHTVRAAFEALAVPGKYSFANTLYLLEIFVNGVSLEIASRPSCHIFRQSFQIDPAQHFMLYI